MRRLLALLACAAVAGCDFTPALDIDTPPHEARAVLRGLLVADSLAVVRVSRSADPFTGAPSRQVPTATDATVTLVRAGAPERLVLRPDTCFGDGYTTLDPVTGESVFVGEAYECGAFVGATPLRPGETVTVRAEVPGLPVAEATVTIPARPDLAATETPTAAGQPRRIEARFPDSPAADRYYLSVLSPFIGFSSSGCDGTVCTDTSGVSPSGGFTYPVLLTTTDPVLIANAIPDSDGYSFFVFADDAFRGGPRTVPFAVDPARRLQPGVTNAELAVRLAAISQPLFEAYGQTRAAAVDRDFAFAEPLNGVTNVVGGYGLVGAAAIAEVRLPARTR